MIPVNKNFLPRKDVLLNQNERSEAADVYPGAHVYNPSSPFADLSDKLEDKSGIMSSLHSLFARIDKETRAAAGFVEATERGDTPQIIRMISEGVGIPMKYFNRLYSKGDHLRILRITEGASSSHYVMDFFLERFGDLKFEQLPWEYQESLFFCEYFREMKFIMFMMFLSAETLYDQRYVDTALEFFHQCFPSSGVRSLNLEWIRKWEEYWGDVSAGAHIVGGEVLAFLLDYLLTRKVYVANSAWKEVSQLEGFIRFAHETLRKPMEELTYSNPQFDDFNEEFRKKLKEMIKRGETPPGYREMTLLEKLSFSSSFSSEEDEEEDESVLLSLFDCRADKR